MHKTCKLDNGITIVHESLPFVRSIALGIWVKSGSKYEQSSINGMSHYIEHMMFKGTNRRTAKDLANEMDSIGGEINAFTSKEYTCYYTVTLDSNFDKALDILFDMLSNSKFSSEDITKEKGVIKEEINMYEDSPEEVVIDELQNLVWKNTSLAMPILGTKETLENIDRNKMLNYFNSHYVPENIIISVAGSFNFQNVYEKLNRTFGTIYNSNKSKYTNNSIKYNSGLVYRQRPIEQIHFCMGFKGLNVGDQQIYPLSILSIILGGGVSSRLFQKVREEKGLAYSIYSYASSFTDAGLFNIYSAMKPDQLERVLNIVLSELNELKNKSINQHEINKTKEHLKSSIILGLESSSSIMSSLGKSQLLTGKVKTPDEIITKIDNVNIDDINEVINKIIDFNNISLSVVGRIEDIDLERIKNICQII